MTQRGDDLLARVCAGENDSTAHDLLDEFHTGYPVDRLRVLLRSDEEQGVRVGAWIASELGENVTAVMTELSGLLDDPARYVRFFVIDAVLAGATPRHGEAIAKVVTLIRDPDEAVRWKVLHFLAKATEDQLSVCIPRLRDEQLAELTAWLLDRGTDAAGATGVLQRLEDPDRLTRLFAGAAAARLRYKDCAALKRASVSMDHEVSSFAKEELEALTDQ